GQQDEVRLAGFAEELQDVPVDVGVRLDVRVRLGANHSRHAGSGLRSLGHDLRQVDDGRLRVQRVEHTVAAARVGDLCDAGVGVFQVTERDRVARAGLRARRLDLAVAYAAPLEPRRVLRVTDALHAE